MIWQIWTQSYKQYSRVELDSMLELTNQISHETILPSLIGQLLQRRAKSYADIIYRIGS